MVIYVGTNYEAENMKEHMICCQDIIGDDLIDVFNNLQKGQRVCHPIITGIPKTERFSRVTS